MSPLTVVTEAGIATSTKWWANIRVEGSSVVLSSSYEYGWPDANLVVAELASMRAAKEMFRTIQDRIALKVRRFDASEWSEHARRDPDNSAEGDGS
jgi:hypothetical protein